MGLLVMVKLRGVDIYCLKLQFYCTYWGGQQNKAKCDAVVIQVTRSSPTVWKFHWPNAVHCIMTRSVVKGSCFCVVDAARHLQQPISRGTYSSLQVALSITTQWHNDCELVRFVLLYRTIVNNKGKLFLTSLVVCRFANSQNTSGHNL